MFSYTKVWHLIYRMSQRHMEMYSREKLVHKATDTGDSQEDNEGLLPEAPCVLDTGRMIVR